MTASAGRTAMMPSARPKLSCRGGGRGRGGFLSWIAISAYACASITSALSAPAEAAMWSTNGPYGVGVQALAVIAPRTLYAGTVFGGVFKSTDGGSSWSAINTNLNSTNIFGVMVDPTAPETIYAGSVLDGVFKSTSGGDSWYATASTPIGYALAMDAADSTILYVGTINGVFKTVDGGDTWKASGLTDVNVAVLAADPSVPGTLYAGTGLDGVFMSSDAGAMWQRTGLSPGAFALAIDPTASNTIYAGTANGVLKSTDHGDHWVPTGLGAHAVVDALAIDSTRPATIYAGVMYSDGSGDGGVFSTTNGGDTWLPMNDGLTNRAVAALVVDPTDPQRLYAATGGGVFAIQAATLAASTCAGGVLTVADVVAMVNVALGYAEPPACVSTGERDGPITIAAIIAAVDRVLQGALS